VDSVQITEAEPADAPGHCSAAVQVTLSDGRLFSVLAATPGWFVEEFNRLGLDFYFGPSILFVRSMELGLVRRAVTDMLEHGDQWLCRYDTPRTTLAKVLVEFKVKHS
jgi:hypothetical protein